MEGAWIEGWDRAFRSLFWRLRPEHLQARVAAAQAQVGVEVRSGASQLSVVENVYGQRRQRVIDELLINRFGAAPSECTRSRATRREQFIQLLEHSIPATAGDGPDFHCDSALGGLARWLRAMGYDACFWPGIDDAELVRTTVGTTAILLTTDSRLMWHGTIAHGAVAALLVPITLDKRGQFEFVANTLELPPRAARCMACGGTLRHVEKESVRERIPPRTYPWRNEYFVCDRCDQLFWEGTHWERIQSQLARLVSG